MARPATARIVAAVALRDTSPRQCPSRTSWSCAACGRPSCATTSRPPSPPLTRRSAGWDEPARSQDLAGPDAIVEHLTTWAEMWESWEVELERVIDAGGDQVIVFIRERGSHDGRTRGERAPLGALHRAERQDRLPQRLLGRRRSSQRRGPPIAIRTAGALPRRISRIAIVSRRLESRSLVVPSGHEATSHGCDRLAVNAIATSFKSRLRSRGGGSRRALRGCSGGGARD
jgi:hypothetical protein